MSFAAFLCMALAPAAGQSCTFTMSNVSFGTIDLTANIAYNTSVTFKSTCTGTADQTVRICPNFNAGSGGSNAPGSTRYLLSGVTQLQYNLYRNKNYTQVWGSDTWGLPPTPPTINVKLKGAGTGTFNQTMRARIFSGQTALPVGVYSSSFAGAQTRVNYAYSTVGTCSAISTANLNPVQVPFTVTATTGALCAVTATDLDFGTRTLLNSNADATNMVSIRCPPATPYTISLDGGLSGASNPTQRKLDSGADQITYGIYRDSGHSQPWGSTIGTNTVASTGTGAFQNFTAYGRIPPQTTPPADIYDDTVVITVTY